MLRLILVRHGEVKGNVDKAYCGWIDHELTENGIEQAKEVALKLKDEPIDKIYVSDLKRTLETAQYINEYHKRDLIKSNDLREINFGLFEGKTYGELKDTHPKELELWADDWKGYSMPEGESLVNMHKRVTKKIDEIIKNEGGTILVVSHAGAIRSIMAHLIGNGIDDYWKYKILNCTINLIEMVEDFPVLLYTNK
ncbi:MAG: alpha-ribazole phosphatase [Anaeromicrobium sp.]|jgi:alpha-ribazole phosphatase|uniref:alpha-ribazole phosphatase n=1 Tax=Anaeromicrobium sp. TaxID=1929132 RepID=UPI0025D46BAA|nr:alpha-ribazole phosphatase [Anaeromicrobium sp.]MCT4593018.1 alpha-ribazole phosphatase [Anaeromicrobium sp.]